MTPPLVQVLPQTDLMGFFEAMHTQGAGRSWTVEDRVHQIAYTGEGEWGTLDWIALGVMTCGIGIPVVWFLKPFAKAYLKRIERKKTPLV